MKPTTPNPKVTNRVTQTKPFESSAHSRVEDMTANKIRKPPIVGVPFLVNKCDSGPSARIGWPAPCLLLSHAITRGPAMKLMNKAVIIAPPVRKVM